MPLEPIAPLSDDLIVKLPAVTASHPTETRRRSSARGAHMQEFEGIKVLFVAGFGPIVGDRVAGRKLYGETLNISFKEEQGHAQNFAHWNWLQSERSWSWRIMSAVVSAIYLSTIRRQRFIPSRRFDLAHIALGSLLGYIDFHWLDGPVAAGRVEQVEWRGRLVSVAPSISSSQPQRGEDSGRGRPKFEPASNGDRSAVDVHAAARCRRRAGAQGLTSSGVPYRPADL